MNIDDITYRINGAIFEVNLKLGAGFLEKVYQNALMIELADRKLKAESQVPITVRYKGVEVGEYFADIIIENQVILELKAIDSLQKIGAFLRQCLNSEINYTTSRALIEVKDY